MGADYYNPDEATRRIRTASPHLSEREANSLAWHQGKRLLEAAIDGRLRFAIETTLGGDTMTALFKRALAEGMEVRMWYVGLASLELHLARVRARVVRGGHDVPEPKIRERFEKSRVNLIRLLPYLTELRVFDNSVDADPSSGKAPEPYPVLQMVNGAIASMCDLPSVPGWAKPIVAAAIGSRKAG
jgi:predicted ABC-type ATPase